MRKFILLMTMAFALSNSYASQTKIFTADIIKTDDDSIIYPCKSAYIGDVCFMKYKEAVKFCADNFKGLPTLSNIIRIFAPSGIINTIVKNNAIKVFNYEKAKNVLFSRDVVFAQNAEEIEASVTDFWYRPPRGFSSILEVPHWFFKDKNYIWALDLNHVTAVTDSHIDAYAFSLETGKVDPIKHGNARLRVRCLK